MTTTTQHIAPVRIGIMGAGGRMGRMLIESILATPDTLLAGAFVRAESTLVGMDAGDLIGAGACGVAISPLTDATPDCDVLIDFSLPDALTEVIDFCQNKNTALVMGVTGLTDAHMTQLRALSNNLAVVLSGNYSTGVNLSLNLIATTAQVLGLTADVEIVETHHKHKRDAPSGTAFMLADTVANARGQRLGDVLVHGREGTHLRKSGEIGMHAVRGGEVVGEHRISFIMDGELIEITHRAQSRSAFASGAVRAALWASVQPAGLYDMQDVLGLKTATH